jgi:hypothetical protein
MTPEERADHHARFFAHIVTRPCPLEAAASALDDDRSIRLVSVFYGILVVTVAGIAVFFPHAKLYDPRTNGEDSFPLLAALLVGMAVTYSALRGLPRLVRERRANHRVASRGPACDPWAGLETDPRSHWFIGWRRTWPNMRFLLGLGGPNRR